MLTITEILNQFEPEPDQLLRDISAHIDDNMLAVIAAADYGMNQDKFLISLRQLRDEGTFSQPMYWYPAEVLELIHHTPVIDMYPGHDFIFCHWMRAFCCAALLRATCEPYNYGAAPNTNDILVRLIQSLEALPIDFVTQAAKFMAWLLLHSEPEGRNHHVCAYGIGLLWFSLHLRTPLPDEILVSLSQWIIRRAGEVFAWRKPSTLKFGVGGPPPSEWELLGVEFCNIDLSSRSPELREWVELIGRELAE